MGVSGASLPDSCIVIYVVENARELPELDDPTELVSSNLTRMECLVKPLADGDAGLVSDFHAYLDTMTNLPLHRAVFERAAALRGEHRIKTPDAIHLAAALEHGCDEFWTNDLRLAGVSEAVAMRVVL